MNYKESLKYIAALGRGGIKPGLSRTYELLEKLGNPQNELKFIHVGGTNGKGSTCCMLSHILVASGYKTGLFTSPYIMRFNERMRINNQDIPDDTLAEIVTRIRPVADAMEDAPSEFEINTAIAMIYFKEAGCDVVVLEVGMGGEFDSTNVIKAPVLSALTAIGMDHVAELGPEITDIARTKCGIIKDNRPVVLYLDEADENAARILPIVEESCQAHGSRLYKTDFSEITPLGADEFEHKIYGRIELGLKGCYQYKNAVMVLKIVEALRNEGFEITDEAVKAGIKDASWPARFETICKKPLLIIDGAHNPHGIRALVDNLKSLYPGEKFIFITGVMADKAVDEMIDMYRPLIYKAFTVTPDNPRALAASELAERIGSTATAAASIKEAISLAFSNAGEHKIIACGSLYMMAEVRSEFI